MSAEDPYEKTRQIFTAFDVHLRRCASHQFSRHAKQIPLSALTLDASALNFLRGAISCKSKSCVPAAEKKAQQAVPLSSQEEAPVDTLRSQLVLLLAFTVSVKMLKPFFSCTQITRICAVDHAQAHTDTTGLHVDGRGFLKLDDFKSAFKRVAPRLPERTVLEAFRPHGCSTCLHLILSISFKNSLNRWDSGPLCAVRSHPFQTVITRPKAIARSQSQYDIRQSPTKISALLSYYDVSRGFSLSPRLQL
ncbi:EF-hand calcium-binding domain-containing protein 11 [Anabarilius grahami]|uniref:EF-hand calcium-binding domain-containing protein 11 n=1 Tax=Anabarilius grahami TaxID=495550 RepID=A0A3N0XVF8_ANAGA|nr:EF-hand calcium-binding domain-containing protein 11 [Anabarilius grahami]